MKLAMYASILLAACTSAGGEPPRVRIGTRPSTAALPRGGHWFRGSSFCIMLASDETIERQPSDMDFVLYDYKRGDQSFVIYEGNYPSPGGVVVQTGLNFPSVLSVHGPRALANRLLVGDRMRACS